MGIEQLLQLFVTKPPYKGGFVTFNGWFLSSRSLHVSSKPPHSGGLSGGVGEVATIFANASRRFDWNKAAGYLERINSGALARRLGWLVDYVKADLPTDARDASFGWPPAAAARHTWGPIPRARRARGDRLRRDVARVRQRKTGRAAWQRRARPAQGHQEGQLVMLTQSQVQRYAVELGLRDIMIAEKEVVLTFLLQLLSERGILNRISNTRA
jgi:hypothetical protein